MLLLLLSVSTPDHHSGRRLPALPPYASPPPALYVPAAIHTNNIGSLRDALLRLEPEHDLISQVAHRVVPFLSLRAQLRLQIQVYRMQTLLGQRTVYIKLGLEISVVRV